MDPAVVDEVYGAAEPLTWEQSLRRKERVVSGATVRSEGFPSVCAFGLSVQASTQIFVDALNLFLPRMRTCCVC